MPAVSKAQYRYIQMLKRRYGTQHETPEEHKWVWDNEWIDNVDYGKLPKEAEHEKSAFTKLANADPYAQYLDSTKYFGRKGSAVRSDMITSAANANNVDPRLLAAIVANESEYGSHKRALKHNNFGGVMGSGKNLFHYATPQDGLNAVAANLQKNYISKGLTTPEQIGPVYAPTEKATNDPQGINKGWIPTVRSIYNRIPSPGPPPVLVTPKKPLLVKGTLQPGYVAPSPLVDPKALDNNGEFIQAPQPVDANGPVKTAALSAQQIARLYGDLSKVVPVIDNAASSAGKLDGLKRLNLNNWFHPNDIVPSVMRKFPELNSTLGQKAKLKDLYEWVGRQHKATPVLPSVPVVPAPQSPIQMTLGL